MIRFTTLILLGVITGCCEPDAMSDESPTKTIVLVFTSDNCAACRRNHAYTEALLKSDAIDAYRLTPDDSEFGRYYKHFNGDGLPMYIILYGENIYQKTHSGKEAVEWVGIGDD